MIYALGHTLLLTLTCRNPGVCGRSLPVALCSSYWAAELAGGITAAAVVALMFEAGYGRMSRLRVIRSCRAYGGQLTFFLMLVIISAATDKRVNGAVPGLATTVVFDAYRWSHHWRLDEPPAHLGLHSSQVAAL